MAIEIPDINWYREISELRDVEPRCPYASEEKCPRYLQSLELVGVAGVTRIEPEERERLEERWRSFGLWPSGLADRSSLENSHGVPLGFKNFCPEVIYKRLSLFASDLSRYPDDISREMAHVDLRAERAPRGDIRWAWASVTPRHFTDCLLYERLKKREKGF